MTSAHPKYTNSFSLLVSILHSRIAKINSHFWTSVHSYSCTNTDMHTYLHNNKTTTPPTTITHTCMYVDRLLCSNVPRILHLASPSPYFWPSVYLLVCVFLSCFDVCSPLYSQPPHSPVFLFCFTTPTLYPPPQHNTTMLCFGWFAPPYFLDFILLFFYTHHTPCSSYSCT